MSGSGDSRAAPDDPDRRLPHHRPIRTRRLMMFIHRKSTAAAVALATVMGGASCGYAAANRAGDNAVYDPVVLTISTGTDNVPVTLEPYIERVSEITYGSLTIEFVLDNHDGDPDVSHPFAEVRDG